MMSRRLTLSGLAAVMAVALLAALLATLVAVGASTSAATTETTAPVFGASADPLPASVDSALATSSPLIIVKTADVSSAGFGDDIEFRLYVHNETNEPVPTLVFDPIAEGTRYVDESYASEPAGTGDGYDPHTNAIYWQGNVGGGATVVIEYKVRVVRCDPHGFNVTNVAVAYAYGQRQLPASSVETVDIEPCKGRDLGDAPDSSNHFDTDMSAYAGVPARFPTVFDHDTGAPPGPLHRDPSAVHLGRGVSFERDADVPPDQDGFTNLLPIPHEEVDVADVATLSGIANLDGFDDGLRPPEIPPCGVWEELPVVVTVNDPTIPLLDGLLYLNIWVDGNHNGRWGDAGVCENGDEGFEWVLQDFEIPMGNLVTGTQIVTVTTTLPVLREPSSDGGVLPAWMRITLSESPAPRMETPHVASVVLPWTDGRGPKDGWELGETEDYYLPGTHRPPVAIDKTADKEVAALGDEIEFTITLTNPTAEPAKVLMYDPIPEGTEYISDTFTSSVPGILEGYNEPLNAVLWQGFVPGNQTVVITFRVQVVGCHPKGSAVLNTAWAYDYEINRATAASVRVKIQPCVGPDLGDAPDSTNHFNTPMTAYPAVQAEFPTVFDAATGTPPGPLHHNAYAAHLGDRVSFERDADQPPDQDGVPNLRPRHDQANLDRYDDAFPDGLPAIAACESWENLPIAITVNDSSILPPDSPLYLNMWVDGTHDGDWTDANLCGVSSEWVLQNHGVSTGSLVAGVNVINVTTLPVFRSESNGLRLPAWLRITLSESPVPVPVAPDIPDGSGPSEGWELGETEDHYLPGDPAISIDKVADKDVAAAGDEIQFTVTLSNGSGVPARVSMYDLIPPGTEYIPNSYVNVSGVPAIEEGYDVGTRPDFGVTRHWIIWRGDVPANGSVVIKFRVRVVRCDAEGFKVINDAWAFEPGLPPVSATAVVEIEPCRKGDLGDAPDSSNHAGKKMTAYPGMTAHFPTVFNDPSGDPPGPMHWRREADTRLGVRVSSERDADLLPDEDGQTNLDPPANKANRDQYDDGLILLAASPFPHCQPTEISVVVTVAPGASGEETPIRERYINAWFDWNRDGDWEDAFDCDTGDGTRAASLEWAVRDYLVRLGPGMHVVTLPAFLPYNDTPTQGLWARITLAEEPAPVNETTHLADGRGPDGGYHDGETEDYLIPGRSDVVLRKAVDKEHARLGAELTYTLTAYNGGDALVAGAHVEDPIPDGTSFVGGSLWASKPVAGFTGTAVTWDGDLEAGETVTISFKVQVAVASSVDAAGNELLLCARVVRNRAELTLPGGETSSSNVVATYIQCPDLGDAPDSSNHYNVDMTAYGTVTATFPTVFQPSSDPAIEPPGPIHWEPLARAWLGYRVSGERDADLMPDEDGRPNLDPVNDRANRDRHDDGLVSLTSVAAFPHCEETTLRVLVNVAGPSPTDPDLEPIREMYINAWFDWDRDGDWEETFNCTDEAGNVIDAPEWAVRDYKVSRPPGLHVVELPAFLPYNPTPDQDLWARLTLSEEPAPLNPDTGLADGRGPDDGYKFGETEDYRFPGRPSVGIRKVVDKERASLGDELTYTLTVHNSGSAPLAGVHVEDAIPDGASFVGGSLWASKPVTGFTGSAVTWDGDVDAGETVTIGFKVKVGLASTDDLTHIELECEGAVRNHAVLLLPDGVSLSSNVAATRILCPDLGDAPDSSNHFNVDMTAYGTVTATFPTVFQPSSDPAIEPPGPIHWQPRRLAWLGYKVSGERDADLMPDEDGRPNLDPVNDSANRDRHDDGLVSLTSAAGFPHCEPTTVRVLVNVAGPSVTDHDAELIHELYINAWFDWNRDGDWKDELDCEQGSADEWAVRDYKVSLPPGLHAVALPAFLPYNPTPDQDLWARISLSEAPAPVDGVTGLADGRGPDEGYKYGETEDYLIPGRPAVDIHKVVDLRHVGLGKALTYTVTVHNGGSALVTGVEVKDAIPEGTSYISGTLESSKPTAYYENGAVHWTGDVEASETVTISFQVRVAALDATHATEDLKCERVIRNYAVLALPNGISYTSNVVFTEVLCPDLGDAPDSTNHFNARMSAYGVVTATFPTVFQPSSDPAIEPAGPLHWRPRADAYLGYWVSGERDADLMPDEDGRPNLKPPHDDANLDRADDGLVEPVRLPHCEQTRIKVRVNWPALTATADATIERYVNVWFDWNRDGDWEDAFDCADQLLGTLEWAVQDYLVTLHPGLHEVELPAFLPYNRTPHRPIWARVTLAEQKAPVNPDNNLADGRGPDAGYRFGETEDYLIPGVHVEPEVKIEKRVDKLHAGLGEELTYTIIVKNGGPDPVAGAHVEDEIPDGTTYVPDSLWASKPVTGFTGSAATWDGDILAGETVTISFKVQVKTEPDPEAVNDERCGRSITNRAVLVLPAPPDESIAIRSNEVHTRIVCPDLGDAPDSSNHHGAGMTTYPGHVPANFPTVFQPSSNPAIGPPGPRHLLSTQDAWLGPRDAPPTGERDADLMPDEDGRPNIYPPDNKADQDEHDNGVFRKEMNLQHCEPATFKYQVTIVGPQRERFVNVWFDWNRDGDWEDVLDCPDAPAPEWAVQNQVISLGPGTHVLTSKTFLPWHPDPDDPMWMRITLAERPVGVALAAVAGDVIPTDGSGPAAGYRYGETEDYLLGDIVSQPPDVWVEKELRFVDFDDEAVEATKPPPARFFFHIEYGNSGGSAAADVVISDTLPMSTTYKGSRSWPDIEPPTVVTPTVTWQAGTLYPGDHGTINLWFHVPAHLFWVLPPGAVLTNTVTITTSTPGDDPSNNTSVITGTIPLLPPRITWPIPGTTCAGTFTVTGKSQLGTFVDLYVGGVYTATASVDTSGNWDVPLTLSNGTHSIYAKARTAAGKESDPSPTVVVIVDDTLAWDPMSMTFTTVAPNGFVWTQHIRTEDGRADPDGWSVFLPTRITETQKYTVTVLTCCSSPTVTLTVSNTVYPMTAAGGGWYETVIDAPGDPSAPITLTVECDGVTSSGSGSGLIDPDGYVFDVDVGLAAGKLTGKTVTALEYDSGTGSWDRWPAELYESQTNPQVTGADGYYSFYTPPGDYQITVDASTGYQGYRSWTLTVISTPVHLDIPLTPVYADKHYVVTMDAAGFVPDTLEVVQGSVVQWTNNEGSAGVWHSATSDVDARTDVQGWDSGLLDSGESYSRRFDTLDTFTYADNENPSLVGTIKVCYLYDFDCDSKVAASDLQAVAALWRTVSGQGGGYDPRYDVDGDGQINIIDIQKAAMQWGWMAPR